MPRRKATKSDDSAAAETRVTRRSLRGEAPPEKTTPEEKPSPKPATKKYVTTTLLQNRLYPFRITNKFTAFIFFSKLIIGMS